MPLKEAVLTKLEEKKKLIDGTKIKAAGTFDAGELYEQMQRWFVHKGYDWKELRYKAVDTPEGGRLTEIKWEASKAVDDYVTAIIEVDAQFMVSEVEATLPNNAKKKMHKGSVEFKFTAYLKKNIEVWKSKLFGDFLGLVYEKILIFNRLKEYEKGHIAETAQLMEEVRLYLGLK